MSDQGLAPCAHFAATLPSGCLVGRSAPRDCREGCAAYDIVLDPAERTPCETCLPARQVWTRVMGYHRPVSAFNPGKQSEHRDRRLFVEPGLGA